MRTEGANRIVVAQVTQRPVKWDVLKWILLISILCMSLFQTTCELKQVLLVMRTRVSASRDARKRFAVTHALLSGLLDSKTLYVNSLIYM